MSIDNQTARIVQRYRKLAGLTVGAVVFLILVGGIVRSTGSGMGCPDWPTCFGMVIPPTDVSQLPENYQEIYKDHGYAQAEFNAFKTWVEYINRLIGVLIGLFGIATLVASLPFRTSDKPVFYMSLLGLLLIIFQGGIGAYVVRSNLDVNLISIHMGIAMLILLVYISAWLYASRDDYEASKVVVPQWMWALGLGVVVLTVYQMMVGTQVREMVDTVAVQLGEENRSSWIAELGAPYARHRFYYILAIALLFWATKLKAFMSQIPGMRVLVIALVVLLGGQILLGIAMHYLSIPPALQPLHLLGATLMMACEFALLGKLYLSQQTTNKQATVHALGEI